MTDPYIIKNKRGIIIEQGGTEPTFDDYPPVIKRMLHYDVSAQLNLLVDDIEAGHFGEAAKNGRFMEMIRQIKAKYPK